MNCLLVIPHYRHLDRLREFLPGLADDLCPAISVMVSDDGSGGAVPGELEQLVARERARSGNARLIPPLLNPRNRGKGGAVYAGWRTFGAFDWFAFVDADGAVPVREINRAWAHLVASTEPPGVLIGSRVAMLGRDVRRSAYRHYSGRVFATVASLTSGLPVYDSQCGLKFVRADVFRVVEPHVQAQRFSFDMELLMLAAAAGFRIEEFPIDWRDVPGGKVSVARDAVPMLLELLRARRNADRFRSTAAGVSAPSARA